MFLGFKPNRYQVIKDLELDLKSLKQQLEFEAEFERDGERRGTNGVRISSQHHSQTAETLVADPNNKASGQFQPAFDNASG